MRTWSILAVLVTANAMMGCGGAVGPARTEVAFAPLAAEPAQESDSRTVEASGLPAAPWADAPVEPAAVPAPILSAWSHADNRAECAPLAPTALGAAEGASARVGVLAGGWSVEFDHSGMPGLDSEGRACERCGRAVFGVAGTNLVPEDLVTEDSPSDLPAPSFADGSHLSVEPPAAGEDVAAAVITVQGQGCVYQVWSFLGEDHVRELVSSLRLVEVDSQPAQVASR